jgi:hypothetical protein
MKLFWVVLLATLTGCGSSTPAATVNGIAISRGTLRGELSAIRANSTAVAQFERDGPIAGGGLDGFSPAFVAQVLTSEIQQVVVAAAVSARRLAPPVGVAALIAASGDPSFSKYAAAYQTTLATRSADRLALAASLAGVSITVAAMQRYYDANLDQFTQYCLDGLAVGSQAAAAATLTELADGGNLPSIARASSVDPNSRADGGVLGCGDSGVFPAFASTIVSLPVGQYSRPIQVGLVWYVVKVAQRTVQTLQQAEPTILPNLITQYGPFNAFLEHALATAPVNVDPALGRFDRSATPPQVAPR